MKMKMPRFGRVLTAAVCVSALVMAGCGGSDDSSTTGTQSAASGGGGGGGGGGGQQSLLIAASGADTYTYMALLQVAIDKGWFKDEGLQVGIVSGEGGGDTLRAATTGSADMAISSGTTSVVAAQDPAQNLKVIGPWYQMNDFVWLTAEPNAQLKDATLGFTSAGSSTELMLKGFQAKLPEDNIKTVAVGAVGDQWAAAKAKRITGGFSLPPYSDQLIAEEGAKPLVSGEKVLGNLPADFVAVNKDYADDHPEALKAFWRVVAKTFGWAQTDPDAASEALAELIPIDAKYIKSSLVQYKDAFNVKVNPEVLKNLSDLMVTTKVVDAPIDWSTALDQQYLPEEDQATIGG
jgi:NitT/TauT family transport system substrate-binding protein